MGQKLRILTENQQQINQAVARFDDKVEEFVKELKENQKFFFNTHRTTLQTFDASKKMSKGKKETWDDYQSGFQILSDKITDYIGLNRTNIAPKAIKKLLELTLISAERLLANAISFANGRGKQTEHFSEILSFQKTVAQGIQVFDPKFQLVNQSFVTKNSHKIRKNKPLSITNFTKDYERAYQEKHGSGCLGFFKLPVKRFFQQSTRSAEVKFLTDVDNYLTLNEAEMTLDDIELMKISALNLVRMKIKTELFGHNSLLHQLVETRLKRAGYAADDNTMMEDFMAVCADRGITMPLSLKLCYENDLIASESSQSTSILPM